MRKDFASTPDGTRDVQSDSKQDVIVGCERKMRIKMEVVHRQNEMKFLEGNWRCLAAAVAV